jgi:hypothetical protein
VVWRKPSEMEAQKKLYKANTIVEILNTDIKPLSPRSDTDLNYLRWKIKVLSLMICDQGPIQ